MKNFKIFLPMKATALCRARKVPSFGGPHEAEVGMSHSSGLRSDPFKGDFHARLAMPLLQRSLAITMAARLGMSVPEQRRIGNACDLCDACDAIDGKLNQNMDKRMRFLDDARSLTGRYWIEAKCRKQQTSVSMRSNNTTVKLSLTVTLADKHAQHWSCWQMQC